MGCAAAAAVETFYKSNFEKGRIIEPWNMLKQQHFQTSKKYLFHNYTNKIKKKYLLTKVRKCNLKTQAAFKYKSLELESS